MLVVTGNTDFINILKLSERVLKNYGRAVETIRIYRDGESGTPSEIKKGVGR